MGSLFIGLKFLPLPLNPPLPGERGLGRGLFMAGFCESSAHPVQIPRIAPYHALELHLKQKR
jgi:hypothetical protein